MLFFSFVRVFHYFVTRMYPNFFGAAICVFLNRTSNVERSLNKILIQIHSSLVGTEISWQYATDLYRT